MTPDLIPSEELSSRLVKVSTELRELEQALKSVGTVDARVLREFRESVDFVRQTAWAVQQWLELQARHADAYGVLSLLTQERIRRATQLSRDIAVDLDATEITFETEGIEALFEGIRALYQRLARLFKR